MDAVEKHFFRIRTPRVPATSTRMFTGEITSATLFCEYYYMRSLYLVVYSRLAANGRSYFAAATSTGIYAGVRGHGSMPILCYTIRIVNLNVTPKATLKC